MSENNCMKRPGIRQKMARTKKGKPSPKKGIKTGKPTWNKGKLWSESTIQKIIKNNGMRGRAPWNKDKPWLEISGENHPQRRGGQKLVNARNHTKRRILGFVPLNSIDNGNAGHHINHEHVIYIPDKIHRSIKHQLNKPETMIRINRLAMHYLNPGIMPILKY